MLHARTKSLNATQRACAVQAFSGFEAYLPRVQWADDSGPRDNAIRQRPAFMRTAIVYGKEPVAQIEDGDLAITDSYSAALAQWYVVRKGNADPCF